MIASISVQITDYRNNHENIISINVKRTSDHCIMRKKHHNTRIGIISMRTSTRSITSTTISTAVTTETTNTTIAY